LHPGAHRDPGQSDELARRYPLVTVDPTVLYVHDRVWTSAGSGAALDLCLELVRHDLGAAVANEVARRIVIPPHRDGGQAQYIRPRPRPTPHGPADVEEWARTNLADVTVTGLAGYAGVSTRTLNRHFRERTGRNPQEWIKRERMLAAQELLEDTDLTVDAIAGRVGLGTAANLRAHFAEAFGTSPSSYRRTFATSLRAGVA
jgi:transcriptional regulator GlxA family with amidase domain